MSEDTSALFKKNQQNTSLNINRLIQVQFTEIRLGSASPQHHYWFRLVIIIIITHIFRVPKLACRCGSGQVSKGTRSKDAISFARIDTLRKVSRPANGR